MDVDISATLLNDPRVSKQLGSTRLETADVLLTHILMRLPIASWPGYLARIDKACHHTGTPLAVLLQDYDARLRKEPLYKVASEVIANLVDLEGDVQESIHVCSDLLFAFFLPPDNHTVFHDDRVMMVIMIVADLVFRVVQAESNEQLALLLLTCGRRVLHPALSESSFIVDHWLFAGWLHEYDKLIDPQRVCDLIADPVMLTIKQLPQIPAFPHSLLDFDDSQKVFSYQPRGTFFVNDPASGSTKIRSKDSSIQSSSPSTSQPNTSPISNPAGVTLPTVTYPQPTPSPPTIVQKLKPQSAPRKKQPPATASLPPKELRAFSSQSYSQSFPRHCVPYESPLKVIIPTTHHVLYSYVHTRIKDELDMACLGKFSNTPLHHKDHVTLSFSSTLEFYGKRISQMETYSSLLNRFLNTLSEAADAEKKNKYMAFLEEYVMASFQPIYYDQIMVICHLTSDLVNHYLQNDDLQMAFNCFSWGYIALRVPAKKDEVVNHGWTKLGLRLSSSQIIRRTSFNIQRGNSLIDGEADSEEMKKQRMSIALNQTVPLIEDPTTSPLAIVGISGDERLTSCILYTYIFHYRAIPFTGSIKQWKKLNDFPKAQSLPAYNSIAEVMVEYGKRIGTTNVYRNILIHKLVYYGNESFKKLGKRFSDVLHEIMATDECVLYDRIMTVALLTVDMMELWRKMCPQALMYPITLYKVAVDVLEEQWCRQVVNSGWGRLPSLKDRLMKRMNYDICTDAIVRSQLPERLPKIYQCAPFLESIIGRTSKLAVVDETLTEKAHLSSS